MKRMCFFLLVAATGCGPTTEAISAKGKVSQNTPLGGVTIDPDHIDLREVLPGSSHTLSYRISSEDYVYEFVDARVSCGCTKPEMSVATLLPHQPEHITVRFSCPSSPSRFHHSFQLKFREPKSGSEQLVTASFSGTSQWPLWPSPLILDLGQLKVGQPRTASIRLHGSFSDKVHAKSILPDCEWLSASASVLPDRIDVTVNPPLGPFYSTIRISTNCTMRPDIVVPVKGVGISSDGRISPAWLSLGVVRNGQAVLRTVVIRSDFSPVKLAFRDKEEWSGRVVAVRNSATSPESTIVELEIRPPDTVQSLKTIAHLIDAEGRVLELPLSMVGIAGAAPQAMNMK
ncbi:MAG: hypothetical protein WCK86_06260 [Planctomycetia bacterium]